MDSDLLFCLRSAYCFLTESFTISYDSLSHYHGENPKNMIFNMMFHDVFIPRMLHFNSFFVCRIPLETKGEIMEPLGPKDTVPCPSQVHLAIPMPTWAAREKCGSHGSASTEKKIEIIYIYIYQIHPYYIHIFTYLHQ